MRHLSDVGELVEIRKLKMRRLGEFVGCETYHSPPIPELLCPSHIVLPPSKYMFLVSIAPRYDL
jgi:hypothetical protein